MKHPIVMLGSGRCGTTLLQRIINTSRSISLWGEHAGFLGPFANAHHLISSGQQIQEHHYKTKKRPDLIIGPLSDFQVGINWLNPFDQQHVHDCFRNCIVELFSKGLPADVRWGFKEILYSADDRVMSMWRTLFPGTQYLFAVRNPFDVVTSMLLAWNRDKAKTLDIEIIRVPMLQYASRWERVNRGILQWTQDCELATHLIRYEELTADPKRITSDLFEFLNEPVPEGALGPLGTELEVTRKGNLAGELRRLLSEHQGELSGIYGETAERLGYKSAP